MASKKLIYHDKKGYEVPLDNNLVRKVIKVVRRGLTWGVGAPKPGKMCVEAAVNYAMGRNHSDAPPCVGPQPRDAKIELNDKEWSSAKARANGLLAIAVAQLGSNTVSGAKFVKAFKDSLRKKVIDPCIKKIKEKDSIEYISLSIAMDRFNREKSGDGLVNRAINVMALLGEVQDAELKLIADCILDALKAVKSPGVKYLGLINEA